MAEEETKDTEVDENSDDQNTEGEAPQTLADESGKINSDVLQSIPVTISVEVGKTSLKIRYLLRLTQVSVVELERLAGEPLDLLVNNTVVAQGEVVLVNDRYGIRLTRVISAEERMKSLQYGYCNNSKHLLINGEFFSSNSTSTRRIIFLKKSVWIQA